MRYYERSLILILMLFSASVMQAQNRTVKGTVTDAQGEPIIGANVVIVGGTKGVITDLDGKFSIEVANPNAVLQVSYIGYKPQESEVGNRSSIEFVLASSVEELDEIVVTALGIRREKKALGYAMQEIKTDGMSENRSESVANMLQGVEVRLGVNYLANKAELDALADRVIYTGPIDAYFDYSLGTLQYRSVRFETETLACPNYQGNAVINYTDAETPYTRIIEHKHFEFGSTEPGTKTVISREYSAEWKPGDEPYYPVNDDKNSALYAKYKALADAEPHVVFGGRLGEYKYYDMDKVIESALACVAVQMDKINQYKA